MSCCFPFRRLAELQGVGDIGEYLEEGAAAFAFPGGKKVGLVGWLVGFGDGTHTHLDTFNNLWGKKTAHNIATGIHWENAAETMGCMLWWLPFKGEHKTFFERCLSKHQRLKIIKTSN